VTKISDHYQGKNVGHNIGARPTTGFKDEYVF